MATKMKVAEIKVITATFAAVGMTPHYTPYLCKEANGVFRGAYMPNDFANYRLDLAVGADLETGKVTWETQAKGGRLPKGTKPILGINAYDWDYAPVVGDVVFAYLDDQNTYRPAVVKGYQKKLVTVVGEVDGEGWTANLPTDCLVVPTSLIINAGLLSPVVRSTYFDGLSDEELFTLGETLDNSGLTLADLLTYRTAAADELPTTKLYKKLGKKAGLEDHHDVTQFLLTGELVDLPKPKKAPRKPAAPKAEVIDLKAAKEQRAEKETVAKKQSKGAADAMAINEVLGAFDALTGAALKKAYTAACDLAAVDAGDRKTKAVDARQHVAEFMTAKIARHLLGQELIQPKALDA